MRWDAPSDSGMRRMAGFRSIPRISSMLFDLELEEGAPLTHLGSGELLLPPPAQLHALLQPRTQTESDLMHAVGSAYAELSASSKELGVPELADRLRTLGYSVRVRTALGTTGAPVDGDCLLNLRHQFLTIILPDLGVRAEAIVDPRFAEQFAVARSTPRYAAILEALPDAYVGTDIKPVVEFLCGELAAAFKESGSTLPPWRNTSALLSKWLPRRSVDQDWPATSEGAAPPSAEQHIPALFLVPAKPPAKPPASSGHYSRAASDVVEDTNSPRPSKTQRLGGAAAATAAANVLRAVGGDSPLRPHPAPPAALHSTVSDLSPFGSTHSPVCSAFRGGGCTAFAIEHDVPGLLRPLCRVNCRGGAYEPAKAPPAEACSPPSTAKAALGSFGGVWLDSGCALKEGVQARSISLDRGSEDSDGSARSEFARFLCTESAKGRAPLPLQPNAKRSACAMLLLLTVSHLASFCAHACVGVQCPSYSWHGCMLPQGDG